MKSGDLISAAQRGPDGTFRAHAAARSHFNVATVDNVLWRLGRELPADVAAAHPFHLTPTIMY